MGVRRILQLGDPLLRAVCSPAAETAESERILTDLRDTLHEFQRTRGFGRGISAVQIGEPKRLLYLEFRGRPYTLINPEWEWRSEQTFRLWDDCFSFPDLLVYVERSCAVRLRYQDPSGSSCVLEAESDLSELLQHEMDHLDGVLTLDRAIDRNSFCTREEWLRQGHPATRAEAVASNRVR